MGKKLFSVAVAVTFLAFGHVSVSVPFIVFHGMIAECSDYKNSYFTQLLSNLSSSPGFCIEVGKGTWDSVFMTLPKQAELACERVKQMDALREGYNIVARSQGNLVARGLIEFCDDGPPVYNYISLAGPHAGIYVLPHCDYGYLCRDIYKLLEKGLYTEFVQNNLALGGYYKDTKDITKYLEKSSYLPKLNNERPSQRNSTYKARFASLHNLVLVMFDNDTIIVPRESSWFGFYPEGADQPLLSAQQTKLYTEDWIGLKTLDVAGKVKFVHVPGGHLEMATPDVIKYVVPYISKTNRKTKEPLSP